MAARRNPVVVSFKRKGGANISIPDVDAAVARNFRHPVDPEHFYKNWYRAFGWLLASGATLQKIVELLEELLVNPDEDATKAEIDNRIELLPIAKYLDAHFSVSVVREH